MGFMQLFDNLDAYCFCAREMRVHILDEHCKTLGVAAGLSGSGSPLIAISNVRQDGIRRYGAIFSTFTPAYHLHRRHVIHNATPSLARLQKRPSLQLLKCLAELLLGVHDDGAVPGDRFLERLSRDQKETDALLTRLYNELIAAIKEDQRAVIRMCRRGGLGPANRFCRD